MIKVFKITYNNGVIRFLHSDHTNELLEDLDWAEIGHTILIEVIEMTQEEFSA